MREAWCDVGTNNRKVAALPRRAWVEDRYPRFGSSRRRRRYAGVALAATHCPSGTFARKYREGRSQRSQPWPRAAMADCVIYDIALLSCVRCWLSRWRPPTEMPWALTDGQDRAPPPCFQAYGPSCRPDDEGWSNRFVKMRAERPRGLPLPPITAVPIRTTGRPPLTPRWRARRETPRPDRAPATR